MIHKSLFAGIILIAALLLGMPTYAGNGGLVGGLVGAGLGGLFGSQFGHGNGRAAATLGGVVVGGLIGSSLGSDYDYENRYYGTAGLPYSTSSLYSYPDYYHTAYVPNYVAPPAPSPQDVIAAAYNRAAQSYCREFTQNVVIDGQAQESYGTACLQPDGSWRVVQ